MALTEDGEETTGSLVLERFVEWKEIDELINNISICDSTEKQFEVNYERFRKIINNYIEQPHLLDSHLKSYLNKLILYIKDRELSIGKRQQVFSYLLLFVNVRGYKAILRMLPHEVTDLEIALNLLGSLNSEANWETHYGLLLWLSIIVMIPFDMSRLDIGREDSQTTADRIIKICEKYLMAIDKSRDIAAYLTAMFAARSDTKTTYLPKTIKWLCEQLLVKDISITKKYGPMMALCSILKHVKREDVNLYSNDIFTSLTSSDCYQNPNSLSRKYVVKCIQRIALVQLKVRVAPWRYKRGCRVLGSKALLTTQEESSEEDSGTYEVSELVEEVMGQLLQALREDNTTIRWSAAKGIGRITERLSKDFGDDVTENILTLFNPGESGGAWNGGCLALAELGRRGLLLPSRIPAVLHVLSEALVYEDPRGTSAGSAVRDAACYTCWSLARAYEPKELQEYMVIIACNLITVALFDREANCRKAASAAFQEHVGRQGSFPHGIDILTIADYFSVGIRKNAFLSCSVQIAKFDEYWQPMIDHLVKYKINHWCKDIRELASKALHRLSLLNPERMLPVLQYLVKNVSRDNINTSHGFLLALGEVVLAIYKDVRNMIDEDTMKIVKNMINTMRGQLCGSSSDMMKEAACIFIRNCSYARITFENSSDVEETWLEVIEECLSYESQTVREYAAEAYRPLLALIYKSCLEAGDTNLMKRILEKNKLNLLSNVENRRIGAALALSSTPLLLIRQDLNEIMEYLTECTKITSDTNDFVNSRKAAIDTLDSIWNDFYDNLKGNFGKFPDYSIVEDVEDVIKKLIYPLLKIYMNGLNDYTITRKGDTGSFVRKASIKALEKLVTKSCELDKSILNVEMTEEILGAIAKQAVEKIGRVREEAGKSFCSIIKSDIPEISNKDEIKDIFTKGHVNWIREAVTYPLFFKLLKFPNYRKPVLSGLVKSVGGDTGSLTHNATNALMELTKSMSNEELMDFCEVVIDVYRKNAEEKSIGKEFLSFLEKLLAFPVIHTVLSNEKCGFANDVYELTKEEVKKTRVVAKLTSSVEILCQLLQCGGKVSKGSLSTLSILLCHQFGWLRKSVALHLSEAVMMYSDKCGLNEEQESEIFSMLTESDWEQSSIKDVREKRDKLCTLLNIPVPKKVNN